MKVKSSAVDQSLPLSKKVKNLRVLLITGALAEETVKRYAQGSCAKTKTIALKISVAALLTPETIAKALKDVDVKGFDVILVPGLVRGDTAIITKASGVQTFKGPRYAADLQTVLDSLGEVELSTVVPACDLVREQLQKKALHDIEEAEQNGAALLKKSGNMMIGNLAVGKGFPMRVLAEIVDATLLWIRKQFRGWQNTSLRQVRTLSMSVWLQVDPSLQRQDALLRRSRRVCGYACEHRLA